ncbi:hypothetical protein Pcinc_012460 [Petrolisthes cinctipes]|uniref:Uncharacterized protein n=1 Tax=Petrolisthes cinctipes TaxID=88211 RepID=A0AAE1G0W9_PETCI|nr:hypothetical protein Pcinc_012460 [Petrolisthes cinctipes]
MFREVPRSGFFHVTWRWSLAIIFRALIQAVKLGSSLECRGPRSHEVNPIGRTRARAGSGRGIKKGRQDWLSQWKMSQEKGVAEA